jgi:hypothetical protein
VSKYTTLLLFLLRTEFVLTYVVVLLIFFEWWSVESRVGTYDLNFFMTLSDAWIDQ